MSRKHQAQLQDLEKQVTVGLHSPAQSQCFSGEYVGEALGGLKWRRLELPLAHIWCGLAFLF